MDIAKALAIAARGLEVPSAELFRSKMIPPGGGKPGPAPGQDGFPPRRRRRGGSPLVSNMSVQEVQRSLAASLGVMKVTRSMLAHTIDLLR